MKKQNLFFLLCSLIMSISAWTGCDIINDDVIVDWAPAEIYITVQDASGKDLLDSLNSRCVLDGLTATFRGETYEVRTDYCDKYAYSRDTRAYMPTWYGLCLINQDLVWNGEKSEMQKIGYYMLYFGEIDGSDDMDEDIILSFANGEKHIIHYHCSHHSYRKASCRRWYSLDGKKTDNNKINIVM